MIFLHSGIFVDFFAIFTCHAFVGYRTQLNSFLSNVAFNGLANGTDLNSVCAVNCEIYVKNIQIYIHTYMTQARFPSLVGLRLRAFGAKPPSELVIGHKKLAISGYIYYHFSLIFISRVSSIVMTPLTGSANHLSEHHILRQINWKH